MNPDNIIQNLSTHVSVDRAYRKCSECLKWERRLQEQVKIVQILTEETMNLHKDKKASEREKKLWESLYKMYISIKTEM